jgi:hypothetical protein
MIMKLGSRLERCASALLVVATGVLVSGTKACQRDYDFASQSNVPAATGTPLNTATAAATTTVTVTITGSITPGTATPGTVTPTGTADPGGDSEETQGAVGGDDLFNELSSLSEGRSLAGAPVAKELEGAAGDSSKGGENWLGGAFSKDAEGSWKDRDGDGFSDTLEEEKQSDPQDSASTPRLSGGTRLEDRVRPQDVEQEADRRGDESRRSGDEEVELDTDVDGIPDEIETQRGLNPRAADSDQDGIRDDREVVLGTNPLRVDSDSDGISDAREYAAGSDPTVPEPK